MSTKIERQQIDKRIMKYLLRFGGHTIVEIKTVVGGTMSSIYQKMRRLEIEGKVYPDGRRWYAVEDPNWAEHTKPEEKLFDIN